MSTTISVWLTSDHRRLEALLVPTPTATVRATLRHVLERHNRLEEEPEGLYPGCDRLLGSRGDAVVAELAAYPPVPASPHNDGSRVMAAVERALARAGHRLLA
jgi:hypothetical protein